MNIIKSICDEMYISSLELNSFVHTAPRRYKKYNIKKRDGFSFRLIAQPSKEVKYIQRLAIDELRKIVPIHDSATAYEPGTSIKINAEKHRKNSYLLKMDLKNFFPSITPDILFSVLHKHHIELSHNEREFLSSLLFWKLRRNSKLRLSIGAPSSPFISNAVMYFFDLELSEYCKNKKITYTRYADDMTFSTKEKDILIRIPGIVKEMLKKHFDVRIKINTKKTVFSSMAFNRHVTGITINNKSCLSLGRDKKRLISSMVHYFKHGRLNEKDVYKLKGLLSHAKHIEPSFMSMLNNKYSKETIHEIFTIAVKDD